MQNTPKYMIVAQDIRQQIESGALKPGDKLKSEQEYAQIYDSSTITIRKGLENLVAERLIYRIKGKGSFVSSAEEQSANSHLMAVVFSIADWQDISFMQIIMGLQRTLAQMNCSLIVEWNNRSLESESVSVRNLIQRKVDGVFLYPHDPDASKDNYDLLEQANIPYIILDHRSTKHPAHFISCDNRAGSEAATRYMLSMNHKKLRFINYEFIFSSEQERYEAFYLTMKKHGLCGPEDELMLSYNEIDFAELSNQIRAGDVTGLVCANDKLAIQCINQLMSHGLRIPTDVSIIGFDDWERNATSPVPLTTIRQSFVNLGIYAAHMMGMLRDAQVEGKCSMMISTELVERESVRRLDS